MVRRANRTPPRAAKNKSRATRAHANPLSTRVLEVLRMLAAGKSTPALAKALFISPKTVRTHIQNILRKLSLHSKLEAVVYAYRNRVAGPG